MHPLKRVLTNYRTLLVIIACVALVAVSCAEEEPDLPAAQPAPGEDSVTPEDPEDDSPIIIGINMAQTGPNALFDQEPAQAALLAIKHINSEGGVLGRQLEGVWLDSRSDNVVGGSNAVDLIDRGAVAMIAACYFDLAIAAATQAQQEGIPIFSCGADPKFGDTQTVGPVAFNTTATIPNQGAVMAEWAYEQGWRNLYVLNDPSIAWSMDTTGSVVGFWEEMGGTVVGQDTLSVLDDVEFGPHITTFQTNGADADVIVLGSWLPNAATLIRQFRAAGIDTPFIGFDALDGELLVETTGPTSGIYYISEGCYVFCDPGADPPPELAAHVTFAEEFEEEYGAPPSTGLALTGYATIELMAAAIASAGSTEGDALIRALETNDVETITGAFRYSTTEHAPIAKTMNVIGVEDGGFVLMSRFTPTLLE